jgi:plastocyanin
VKTLHIAGLLCAGTLLAPIAGASAAPSTRSAPKMPEVRIVTDSHTVGRYTPKTITVRLGARILFKNVSKSPHTVSADKGSFDSGLLKVGKSWTAHATKTGKFTYFCQFHAGMHGTIIVKP